MDNVRIGHALEQEIAAKSDEVTLHSSEIQSSMYVGQYFEGSRHNSTPEHHGAYSTILQCPQETIAKADLSGQYPLYWRQNEGGITLDTTPATLGQLEIDPIHLAATVLGIDNLLPGTIYKDVQVIQNGQEVTFAQDGSYRVSLPHNAPQLDRSKADAVASLRDALTQAIQLRMQVLAQNDGIATADFSGGLDSTSIALLAAQNYQLPLDVFIQYHPGCPAGDLRFAREYAQSSHANVTLHELNETSSELPFSDVGNMLYVDMPHTVESIRGCVMQRLGAAARSGSNFHFMGEGGDAILDLPPQVVIDVAKWQPENLDHEVLTRARIHRHDPNKLRDYALRNVDVSLAENLAGLAAFLRNPTSIPASPWVSLPPKHVVQWFSPEVRHELAARMEAAAQTCHIPESMGIADFIARTAVHNSGLIHRYMRVAAESVGTTAHAPLLDDAVVKACLDTPAFERSDPRILKGVLREAFDGILPTSLLARTSKGAYNGEFHKGIRQNTKRIHTLLQRSQLTAMGILDSNAVSVEVAQLELGVKSAAPFVTRAIMTEQWLRARGEK